MEKEYFLNYYINNKEKHLKSVKKYYNKNKEKIKQYRKKYNKIHYLENKENLLNNSKKYYNENKEKIKQYVQNNKQKINKRMREYFKERRESEPLFKLSMNTRIRLNQNIKNAFKNDIYFLSKRFTFSWKELKEHLEKQFTPLMNWNNYGKYWVIDHKIPLSWFNNEIDFFSIGWNINNLRPLEKDQNSIKSNKYAIVGDLVGYNKEIAILAFKYMYKK